MFRDFIIEIGARKSVLAQSLKIETVDLAQKKVKLMHLQQFVAGISNWCNVTQLAQFCDP